MKHWILMPDSFKGTMSSTEICSIMKQAILQHYPDAQIDAIPVADGGEGSVDCFLEAVGGERVTVTVSGPFGEPMESYYGIISGQVAVIEMASCAGLPLVGDRLQPDQTTTYGVGELMLHAAKRGCKKIIVGLGGSSTNDAGAGAAAACGVRFYDKTDSSFVPTGGTLSQVKQIDCSALAPELSDVEIVAMCDIDNPFHGKNGAAYIFGPQKGADPAMVEQLDQEMTVFAQIIQQDLGIAVAELPGAGAAGGMGGGMVAFFGAKLQMGIETVLDAVHFDQLAEDADIILTGEGKIDHQSLRGKVVMGIARRAKQTGTPVVAIVGDIGDNIEAAYDQGVTGIFSINRVAKDFKLVKGRSKNDMALTIDNLLRFCKTMGL